MGWRAELLVLAGLAVLAVPLHVWAVPAGLRGDDHKTEPAHKRRRVTPSLARLAVAWALFFGVYAAVFTFAPEWAGGGPEALLTVSLIAWTALIFAPIVGGTIDRVGHPSRWLSVSLMLLGITLIGMSLGAIPPAPAMVLVGLSVGSALTATYSLPGRLVPAANIGFAFGFITAFSNLATLVGPATTGAIKDNVAGWTAPWALLASTALLGALFAAAIRPGALPD